MKARSSFLCLFAALFALVLAGCGPSKDELAARERQRIEQEKQAAKEAEKANKAITDNNKKMFSRINASSPGSSTPTDSASATSPAPTTEPKKP
jgi:hypothetical protein